jgi:hypothetical protein
MIRLYPGTLTRCAHQPAPLAVATNFGPVRARLGLALRFFAAAVLGVAIVVGSIVVWALSALAIAIVGDLPPRRSEAASVTPSAAEQ